jgi:protein-disulfide isomerase
VFALPYTLFSIYYQGVVLKKWCVLCLSVQVLLWAEFSIFFFSGVNLSAVQYVSMPQIFWVLSAFALPILLWVLVKPAFLALQERKALRKSLAKFQRNGVIFEAFLQAQKHVQVGKLSEEFILGNAEAPLTLIIFTNPYCVPCGVAHQQLESLLYDFQEDIKIIIRFAVNPNLSHVRNQIVKHLLYLYRHEGQAVASKALLAWYAQRKKEYTTWAKQFPATFGEEINEVLEEHLAWSGSADIEATPTIFVEGQQLSHPYQISDLKYFIKNMTPTYA